MLCIQIIVTYNLIIFAFHPNIKNIKNIKKEHASENGDCIDFDGHVGYSGKMKVIEGSSYCFVQICV